MFPAAAVLMVGIAALADLPSRFAGLLERDDRSAVVAAAMPDQELGVAIWKDLRDAIEQYECIDVRAARTTAEAVTESRASFQLDIIATARTVGGTQREVLLPRRWVIEYTKVGAEWRLSAAMTLERHVIEKMFAVKDTAAREEILRAYADDVDPVLLASATARWFENRDEDWAMAFRLGAMSGDPAAESFVYRTAASAYARFDFAAAREYARKSHELAQQSENLDAIAESFHALGYAAWRASDDGTAIEMFSCSADLVDRLEDPRIALKSMQMAGMMERGRGNLYASAPFWDRSATLSRKYGWIEGELNARLNLSGIHEFLGNRATQDAILRDVMRAGAGIGWRHITGAALHGLFDSQLEAHDYAGAEAVLQSLRTFPYVDELATKSGLLAAARGDLAQADCHFQQARRSREPLIALSGILHLGRLRLLEERFAEALALSREAAILFPATPSNANMSESFHAWAPPLLEGKALRGLGRRDEAVAAFERTIGMIEAESSVPAAETAVTFLRDRSDAYLDLLGLHVTGGDAVEALRISERLKARVLKDVLAHGSIDLRTLLTAGERAEEEALDWHVTELNRAIAASPEESAADLRDALTRAQIEQQSFGVRMQLAHPELARASPAHVDAAAVRRWLDDSRLVPAPDAIVLDYVVAEEETILFALTRETVRILRLPIRRDELRAAAGRLGARIERRDLGYAAAAEELYDRLIAPASALLAGKRSICIIPHGPLWQVPFAVLRAPDGTHLLERAAIHYAPSLSYLDLTAGASQRWLPESPRVLALGNPTIGGESRARVRALTRTALGDLPEAEREARSVGKLYGASRARVLVASEATEEAVKSAAATQDILHFATHGISHTVQPLYSSLVLAAGSDREDGLLEAREIVRMNVPARLAVLSACETAGEGVVEGEGVIGLSWAFLVAGCSRTVATQWRADSTAAMKAMVALHRRIATTPGGGSLAAALREAQLSLLRTPRYSHPYYWGGFVVVGAGW